MVSFRGGGRGSRFVEDEVFELVEVDVRHGVPFGSGSSSFCLRPLAALNAAEPVSSTRLLKFFRASSKHQRLSGIFVNSWLDPYGTQPKLLTEQQRL